METIRALLTQWLPAIQSLGIISTFLFAGFNYRREFRSRRVLNFIELSKMHKDVWKAVAEKPELNRIFEENQALMKERLTINEVTFLQTLFGHLHCYFEMDRYGQIIKVEGIENDLRNSFKAPLLRKYWEENKRLYSNAFISYVERTAQLNPDS